MIRKCTPKKRLAAEIAAEDEWRREYRSKPGVKERARAYQKAYSKLPHAIAAVKAKRELERVKKKKEQEELMAIRLSPATPTAIVRASLQKMPPHQFAATVSAILRASQ